jgi:hypothetical protein
MLGLLSESSSIWAALATKTAFGAPKIALHPATSSPSGLPCHHQEHFDATGRSERNAPPCWSILEGVSVIDQRIDMQPCTVRLRCRLWRQLVTESLAFPHFNPGEFAMITAEKCRTRATECKALAASIDIPTQRSLEQSIMALNWEALADQIDDDNSQATEARLVALFAGLFRRPLAA